MTATWDHRAGPIYLGQAILDLVERLGLAEPRVSAAFVEKPLKFRVHCKFILCVARLGRRDPRRLGTTGRDLPPSARAGGLTMTDLQKYHEICMAGRLIADWRGPVRTAPCPIVASRCMLNSACEPPRDNRKPGPPGRLNHPSWRAASPKEW
jgi:hypothetical protein